MKTKLNLGCGKKIFDDFVNLDIKQFPGIDILWDLNITPYPFDNNRFDYILMDNIFEHIQNRKDLLWELKRIGKNNAIIDIIIPHFSSYTAYRDIEHSFFCSYFAFDNIGFKIIEKKFECFKGLPLHWVWDWFANLFPKFTDIYLHKFLPVQTLKIKLQIQKNGGQRSGTAKRVSQSAKNKAGFGSPKEDYHYTCITYSKLNESQ